MRYVYGCKIPVPLCIMYTDTFLIWVLSYSRNYTVMLPDLTEVKDNVYTSLILYLRHVGMLAVRFPSRVLLINLEGQLHLNPVLTEASINT